MDADTITIEPRFNGPPESGNGGYTCGRLAAYVDGPVEVTLRLPPPLGKPLRVERDGDGARLLDGDALVADAQPTRILDIEPPPPISLDEAAAATGRSGFLDEHTHPFPSCFVCGPTRDPHDGLRIFPGAMPGNGKLFAATWTPDEEAATRPELIWAALDCPTSAPVWNDPTAPDFRPVVLARFATQAVTPVTVGEPYTIISWALEFDGRKRHSAAALYTPAGDVAAVARALWIELKPAAG